MGTSQMEEGYVYKRFKSKKEYQNYHSRKLNAPVQKIEGKINKFALAWFEAKSRGGPLS